MSWAISKVAIRCWMKPGRQSIYANTSLLMQSASIQTISMWWSKARTMIRPLYCSLRSWKRSSGFRRSKRYRILKIVRSLSRWCWIMRTVWIGWRNTRKVWNWNSNMRRTSTMWTICLSKAAFWIIWAIPRANSTKDCRALNSFRNQSPFSTETL